jgi:hypothetical protein
LGQQIPDRTAEASSLVRRHLVIGWGMLLVFLVLGLVLDALLGFKVAWYVNVGNTTRRLVWTLAHAHGVLLGLVNLGFALTVHLRPFASRRQTVASACFVGASVLLPGGFLLGGLVIYDGDPGLGIYLTPIGGLLLLGAVILTFRDLFARQTRA